jgi:ADP-heptose:LPS heptosyltransferase
MDLRVKKIVDYYIGGALRIAIWPLTLLLGYLLRRNHNPQLRGDICFVKMLGGGSLIIAYPALLGLRCKYPSATFSLITTKSIKPFAETLGIFDRIDIIDDSSLVQLIISTLRCLAKNFGVDTVVDLEVYSRLTTVLSTLTAARNRIGFYLEAVFWRKGLHTHLIFFNRSSGVFHWYDAVAYLLEAEPAPVDLCRRRLQEKLKQTEPASNQAVRIAIGHACSELASERMLTEYQWLSVFQQHLEPTAEGEIIFLGVAADHALATKIANIMAPRFPRLHFRNLCGELRLPESVSVLATCQEFWGIDSALLHYARLLGLKCLSYWGPTDPETRLRPIPGLIETTYYRKVPCAPCVHVAEEPPCQGNNICIQSLFNPTKDYNSISWLAYGTSNATPISDERRTMIHGMNYSQ